MTSTNHTYYKATHSHQHFRTNSKETKFYYQTLIGMLSTKYHTHKQFYWKKIEDPIEHTLGNRFHQNSDAQPRRLGRSNEGIRVEERERERGCVSCVRAG